MLGTYFEIGYSKIDHFKYLLEFKTFKNINPKPKT